MPEPKNKAYKISANVNLLVALQNLGQGETGECAGQNFRIHEKVRAKHKFAATDLQIGDSVYMYGVLVGETTRAITKGELVNTRNLVHRSAEYSSSQSKNKWTGPGVDSWQKQIFMGYNRGDGLVGTANYWLVIPMVFCENGNVEIMRNSMVQALGLAKRSQYERFAEELAKTYTLDESPEAVTGHTVDASVDDFLFDPAKFRGFR